MITGEMIKSIERFEWLFDELKIVRTDDFTFSVYGFDEKCYKVGKGDQIAEYLNGYFELKAMIN